MGCSHRAGTAFCCADLEHELARAVVLSRPPKPPKSQKLPKLQKPRSELQKYMGRYVYQRVLNGEFLNGDVCKLVPNGPKRARTGPNGPNWAFWAFARNAQLDILGIRPKCPIGPVWAQSGPIGPIWAQMDTPKCSLNIRHPTSVNCGDNLPKTGAKVPRL